jgi:cytochrome c oxidase assembly factor CtaG
LPAIQLGVGFLFLWPKIDEDKKPKQTRPYVQITLKNAALFLYIIQGTYIHMYSIYNAETSFLLRP